MDPSSARLLIVDDDEHIRTAIGLALRHEGYLIQTARSGHEALERLQRENFDLILVDLRMPGVDGMMVVEKAAELQSAPAIIILTAHPTVESAIAAVRTEAVLDYLVKPVNLDAIVGAIERALGLHGRRMQQAYLFEVVRRTIEMLRPLETGRSLPSDHRLLQAPPLLLDLAKRVLSVAGDPVRQIELTESETKLLAKLMEKPNHVCSLMELAHCMGYRQIGEEAAQNIVRSCIFRLRKKIELDLSDPQVIRTVRGRGYFLASE